MIVDIKDIKKAGIWLFCMYHVCTQLFLVLHLYLIRTNGLFLGYMNHPGFSFWNLIMSEMLRINVGRDMSELKPIGVKRPLRHGWLDDVRNLNVNYGSKKVKSPKGWKPEIFGKIP